MDDVVLDPAPGTGDVLPTGVRRRWNRADALLPAVLAGELLAGVLLGVAWDVASTVPAPRLAPPSLVASTSGVVSVPLPVQAPVSPPPPRRTVPRNPFAVQAG